MQAPLFLRQLCRVRKMLQLAAATVAKMIAARINAICRVRNSRGDASKPLPPTSLKQSEVDDIARQGALQADGRAFMIGDSGPILV